MNIASYSINLKKFDFMLFAPVLLLVIFGLSSIYSMTLNVENPDLTLFNKQIIFAIIGFVLLFFFSFFDYRFWKNYTVFLYLSANIFLAAVLFFGQTIRGTSGWFNFWGISFQPVEFAKFSLVIALAHFYNLKYKKLGLTSLFFFSGLIAILPIALTIFQPDFGSAFILIIIWFGFFILFGIKKKQFLYFLALIATVALILWNFILFDYQQNRILVFVDPGRDPLGSGYNVRQSIIAVGSGKFTGRGLGLGTQSQLRFLPEIATDFIYANISESLGFYGATMVVVFFTYLFAKLLLIIKKAEDDFGAYLVYGFLIIFFSQTFIHIGMNIGLFPVAGLPLPLVSYGGSFLVVCLVGIGIVESVSISEKQ